METLQNWICIKHPMNNERKIQLIRRIEETRRIYVAKK